MPETPREYKKRIEEKWKKNEKNKEELIKKIEGYELLDERFKTKTKKEILANFEKNQKAELEGQQYTTIVSELGKIDKKYEELEKLKEQLETKKLEKEKTEFEIKGIELNGTDETTLKLQMANLRKLNEKLENLKSEVKELDKEIKNMEQEIKEIEDSYGKKIENNEEHKEIENGKEIKKEQRKYKPETLKEVHEQTIKELWEKDEKRNEIIKILDKGVGIDNELKEKIKEEIFKRFFEYYDEKQGNLKVKSARYIKNKLKHTEKIRREKKEELETIYGVGVIGKDKMNEIIGTTIKHSNEIFKIGGKYVYNVEDENRKHYIIHGKNLCGEGYDKIHDVKEYKGELIFTAEKDGKLYLTRGDTIYEDVDNLQRDGGEPKIFTCTIEGKVYIMKGKEKYGKGFDKNYKIGKINEIGGKLVFQVWNSAGYWEVHRGNTTNGEGYEKIHEIKEIGGELVFTAERNGTMFLSRGDKVYKDVSNLRWEGLEKPLYTCRIDRETWIMYGKEKLFNVDKVYAIGEVKEIGGNIAVAVKDSEYFRKVYRNNIRCGDWYERIGPIKDIGGRPAFQAKPMGTKEVLVRGQYEICNEFNGVSNPIDIGGKPAYKVVDSSGAHKVYRGRECCGYIYDKIIGEIKEVDGKPNFIGIRDGVKHEVLGTEEI